MAGDPAAGGVPGWVGGAVVALQVALAIAYALCAHAASTGHGEAFAVAALAVLVLMVVLPGIADRRRWARIALPAGLAAVWWLHAAGHAMLPLLLAPVAFVALIAWWFGRSLASPHGALISRIVAALERVPVHGLEPAILRYTRGLTASWAVALTVLAACNLLLALLATPGGLLDQAGIAAPWPITPAQWSWFANLATWGIVGGLFVIEYPIRKRRFPNRYRNFGDFLRRMAGLGPAFWRELMR